MAGEIKPALTPEEWTEELRDNPTHEWFELTDRHRAAALALYGQPFGFTHEDVRALRRVADLLHGSKVEVHNVVDTLTETMRWQADILYSLAGRIEALLPPLTDRSG